MPRCKLRAREGVGRGDRSPRVPRRRAASRAAALVEPLQPGPQQYVTITWSRGRDAVVSGLMVRVGRLMAPGTWHSANACGLRGGVLEDKGVGGSRAQRVGS